MQYVLEDHCFGLDHQVRMSPLTTRHNQDALLLQWLLHFLVVFGLVFFLAVVVAHRPKQSHNTQQRANTADHRTAKLIGKRLFLLKISGVCNMASVKFQQDGSSGVRFFRVDNGLKVDAAAQMDAVLTAFRETSGNDPDDVGPGELCFRIEVSV